MIPVLGETAYGRFDDHALGGLAFAHLLASEFSLRRDVSVLLSHKDDVFEPIVILYEFVQIITLGPVKRRNHLGTETANAFEVTFMVGAEGKAKGQDQVVHT